MGLGVVLGLAASASWAGANVFIQRSGRALGALRALVWTQIFGGVVFLPVAVLLDRRSAAVTGGTVAWLAVAAASAVLAYATMFYSMARGRLSIVVPVMSSWAAIAAVFSIALLGEPARRTHLIGGALVLLGVIAVSRFSQAAGSTAARASDARALFAAAGAAIGFGILIPSIDRLAPAIGRLGAIPVVYAVDLLVGLPLALAARVDLRPPERKAWPPVAAAGILETVGFVCISLGVERAPVAVVSPLSSLAAAFTVAFAWAVLGERPTAPVIVGAALASLGVVTLAL